MTDETSIPRPRGSEGCLPEWIYSVYVDRELEPDEMRNVAAHLESCPACSQLVTALEHEASSLRAALRVEEPAPAPRAFAVGVGATLVAALLGLTALGWVLDTRTPSALEWLNPFEWTVAFGLVFDAVSMLRAASPLYRPFVLGAGLLSVVFLLTTCFQLVRRRFSNSGSAALLAIGGWAALSALPVPAEAFDLLLQDEEVTVPAGEVVEQTWVTSAETVTIDGTLRGDLLAAGDRVVITGTLDGNLVSAARKVDISGRVTGSIVAVGERVLISGEVGRNAYAAAEQVTVTETGTVGRDFLAAGKDVLVSGTVGRDARAFATWLEVRGKVGRDLDVRAERAEITSEARVGRDLHAVYLEDEAGVVVASSAIVEGQTTLEPAEEDSDDDLARYTTPHFYLFLAISWAAAFVSGMLMVRLAPWLFDSRIGSASDFFRSLAHGFVALVATPIGLVVLALTIIGIPVAMIGALVFGACVYFAKIVVGALIGASVVRQVEEPGWRGFALPLVVGLAIVFVAISIPYLGGIVHFVTLLVGLGAIVDRLRLHFRA